METVSAQELFYGIAARAGILPAEVDTDLFQALRGFLSRRLREGWRKGLWPDLMRWERRYFRPLWLAADAPYAAGTEVFHAASAKYFQALKQTSAEPDEEGTEWALCQPDYCADEWAENAEYEPGDRVRYAETDSYYQMHTAAAAGTAPTETSAWGELKPFDRYVAYEQVLAGNVAATKLGDVIGVTLRNPKIHRAVCPLSFSKSDRGIQVFDEVPAVWIEFRLRCPVLKGDQIAGIAYDVGQQVYAPGSDGVGEFWTCVEAAAAGETPAEVPDKWERVELPRFLESWLVQAGYADWLEMEGQKEKAQAELGLAYGRLDEELMVLGAAEGQVARTEVGTR